MRAGKIRILDAEDKVQETVRFDDSEIFSIAGGTATPDESPSRQQLVAFGV